MKPIISAIVPIFNVEDYLEECLDSLLAQSFDDFEVIGVDDGCSDRSPSIFQNYAANDGRFRLIQHDQNIGLPSARNTGIRSSSGEYLFFLDSDDWISPHAFAMLHELITSSQSDIAMGGVIKCDEIYGKASVPENHAIYMQGKLKNVSIFNCPNLFYSVISCNKLIRHAFISKTKLIFNPSPRRFEDMLTYKWYLAGATVSLTTEITYFYRHRSSKWKNPSIMQEDSINVLKDKICALMDIAKYTIQLNLFNSTFDPLNSKYAMMNLPRALSWILPKMFKIYNSTVSKKTAMDELASALNVYRQLCSILPVDYIETWPDQLKKSHALILRHDPITAIPSISNLFDHR